MKKSVSKNSRNSAWKANVAENHADKVIRTEQAASAADNLDAKPANLGHVPGSAGRRVSDAKAIPARENDGKTSNPPRSPTNRPRSAPRPEDTGFALTDLNHQLNRDYYIFLGLRVSSVSPLRLQLIAKLYIGSDEAVARRILRAVAAAKEGSPTGSQTL